LAATDSKVRQQVLAWAMAAACNALFNPISECRHRGMLWLTSIDKIFMMTVVISMLAVVPSDASTGIQHVPKRLRPRWKQFATRA